MGPSHHDSAVTARCWAVLLLAGAVLAGCGASGGPGDPIAPLHLRSSRGPIPTSAAFYLPGQNLGWLYQCDNLWGYLTVRPSATVPGITASDLHALLLAGNRVSVLGDRVGDVAMGEYFAACNAIFRG